MHNKNSGRCNQILQLCIGLLHTLAKKLEEMINLEPHATIFQVYFTPNNLKNLHDAIALVAIRTKFAQVNILAKLFYP
jgi:hypothetical protein